MRSGKSPIDEKNHIIICNFTKKTIPLIQELISASENKNLVLQVSKEYDVDPFIILSIAGIESNYGRHYKGYTVFNSLYTQIHEMPKRAKWASNELASYLDYCYKDNVDP